MKTKVSTMVFVASLAAAVGMPRIAFAQSENEIAQMKAKLAEVMRQQATEQKNLENFDDLDFNVYSNQQWDQLKKSHADDVLVHYPDGSTTKGLVAHIEKLKPVFVFAPDHKIVDHPIRIAAGNWTAVMGTFTGTFTRPMPLGDGQSIPPTGKAFKMNMVTIGRWEGPLMVEEWLFWDNQEFAKQIGLAK